MKKLARPVVKTLALVLVCVVAASACGGDDTDDTQPALVLVEAETPIEPEPPVEPEIETPVVVEADDVEVEATTPVESEADEVEVLSSEDCAAAVSVSYSEAHEWEHAHQDLSAFFAVETQAKLELAPILEALHHTMNETWQAYLATVEKIGRSCSDAPGAGAVNDFFRFNVETFHNPNVDECLLVESDLFAAGEFECMYREHVELP